MSHTRFYNIWNGMRQRCFNPKRERYSMYGGRGIIVCNEWLDIITFKKDMYDSYVSHCKEFGEKQTSIDRIDNDGDYCKENCKWATHKEQGSNTRSHYGSIKKKQDFSKIMKGKTITYVAYYKRKRRGYTDEEILKIPQRMTIKEVCQKEYLEDRKDKVNSLPDNCKKMIIYRFGIYDGKLKTLQETGNHFGISRERVRQLIRKGMERIFDK